ncbi:MAG: conjugal transfer protein TraF [bacterium]
MAKTQETEKAIKELKIVKAFAWITIVLIIITALVFIITLPKSFALSVNQIIKYKNASYKVIRINHKKTYALICPYYNYRQFYSSRNWGWLYGQNCRWINVSIFKKAESKTQKQKFNPESATSYSYLNSLSAKRFKKYYKDMTDISVMRPTEKNIARYTFMTNFMRQKSLQFAYAYYTYILNHPQYNMAGKIGTTSWSYRETSNYSTAEKKLYIHKFKNKIGLFFFFSKSDAYSLKQVPIMNWLLNDNRIVTIGVSNDGCPSNLDTKCVVSTEAFKYYNIKNIPEIIMIYRKKDGSPAYQIIGAGLTPESTIISRIFFYLHSRNKVYYKNKNFEKISGAPFMGK